MSNARFKAGDKVRYMNRGHSVNPEKVTEGDVYTVKRLSISSSINIILEEVEQTYGDQGWVFFQDDFDLVSAWGVSSGSVDDYDRAMKGI